MVQLEVMAEQSAVAPRGAVVQLALKTIGQLAQGLDEARQREFSKVMELLHSIEEPPAAESPFAAAGQGGSQGAEVLMAGSQPAAGASPFQPFSNSQGAGDGPSPASAGAFGPANSRGSPFAAASSQQGLKQAQEELAKNRKLLENQEQIVQKLGQELRAIEAEGEEALSQRAPEIAKLKEEGQAAETVLGTLRGLTAQQEQTVEELQKAASKASTPYGRA